MVADLCYHLKSGSFPKLERESDSFMLKTLQNPPRPARNKFSVCLLEVFVVIGTVKRSPR
jgi:hypothetical protein